MKISRILTIMLLLLIPFLSCELLEGDDDGGDDTTVGGEQSSMGNTGSTYSSSSAEVVGVSELNAEVASLDDGVSTFKGSAIVTNPLLKNVLSNIPEITLNGDTATTINVKIKQSKEGIQLLSGPTPGVLVKYDASVGDTYPIGDGVYERRVVSKSTTDDYYYGFFMIKVIEVEEDNVRYKSSGIDKVTYWANHRFGLVGIKLTFDDQTSATFPVYCSAEN